MKPRRKLQPLAKGIPVNTTSVRVIPISGEYLVWAMTDAGDVLQRRFAHQEDAEAYANYFREHGPKNVTNISEIRDV